MVPMVALSFNQPQMGSSYRSLYRSLPSSFFSNHQQGRNLCFYVSSVLSSPPLVEQSNKFMEASRRGNLIPLHQCIFSDQLTPVLAYRCLVNENDHESPSFLLESVEPGLHSLNVGRYSVVGANPTMEIMAKKNTITMIDHHGGSRMEEYYVQDPLMVPQRIMESWVPHCLDELPQVFCGGWFGHFSHDSVRYSAKRDTFSSTLLDDMNIPDLHLGLYDDILVFDHVEKKIYVIHWVQLDRFPSTEAALDNGAHRLESLLSKVHDIVNPRLCPGSIELNPQNLTPKLEVSTSSKKAYKNAILNAKQHILSTNTSQVVLSQQFERRTFCDPFELYRALSIIDPSPLMAYIQARGGVFVASSPEILTCVNQNREITTRPLSGTIDRKLRTLQKDSKHYNELNMMKAFEITEELGGGMRGPYDYSFGCISFSGDMDFALSSKTILFPTQKINHQTLYSHENVMNKQREWTALIQGQATVMADSDPEDVERVCESEAADIARVIDLAESSFLTEN